MMKNSKLKNLTVWSGFIVVLSILAVQPVVAAPIIIDPFSDDPAAITSNATQDDASILGGQRDVDFFSIAATWDVGSGVGSLGNVTQEGEFRLSYDGVDASVTNVDLGLGSVDLTDLGSNDRFQVTFNALTGSMTGLIRTYTTSSDFINFPFEIDAGAGTYEVLFSAFGGQIGTPDLTNTSQINLWLGTTATNLSDDIIGTAESFQIDNFQITGPTIDAPTIPVPGSFVLLCTGLAGLGFARRRTEHVGSESV